MKIAVEIEKRDLETIGKIAMFNLSICSVLGTVPGFAAKQNLKDLLVSLSEKQDSKADKLATDTLKLKVDINHVNILFEMQRLPDTWQYEGIVLQSFLAKCIQQILSIKKVDESNY